MKIDTGDVHIMSISDYQQLESDLTEAERVALLEGFEIVQRGETWGAFELLAEMRAT